MAKVIDFNFFRETGDIKTPEEAELIIENSLPDLDQIASVMGMTTDELVGALHTRIMGEETLRDIPTDMLISELLSRMSVVELICLKAAQMENSPN